MFDRKLDRRQILAGLGMIAGTMAVASLFPRALWAAAIKPDDASALLVIDVQNCFLPGGSLAVKDGEQVVPVINRIAKGFANVVMTQDWHTAGHISFASSHAGQEAVRDRRSALRQAGAVARSLRAGNRRRVAVEGSRDPAGRADHPQGLSQGCRQLFGVHRGRRQDHDRPRRLSQGAPGRSACSWPAWPPISAWHGPRSMRARPVSRPMWSKTPAAASTPRARWPRPGPIWPRPASSASSRRISRLSSVRSQPAPPWRRPWRRRPAPGAARARRS